MQIVAFPSQFGGHWMNTKEKVPTHMQSTPAAFYRFPPMQPSSTGLSPQRPCVTYLCCSGAHLWIVNYSAGMADPLAASYVFLSGLPSFATVLVGIVPPEKGLGL